MNTISGYIRAKRNFFVGLFVIIPVIIGAILLGLLILKSDYFEKWSKIYVVYDDVFGLKEGNSVSLKGIKIGHVNSISFANDGNILVELKIKEKYLKRIHKYDLASLYQKNFVVGDWEISIKPSLINNNIVITENDTLKSHMPIRIQKTLEQVARLFNVVETFTLYITSGQGLFGQLITNDTLFTIAQDIVVNTNKLVKNANKLLYKAGNTLNDANGILNNFNGFTNNANSSIDSLKYAIVKASNSFEELNRMIEKFNQSPDDIRNMLGNIDSTMKEGEILFKALQDHWLFRGQVKKYRKENEEKRKK